MHQRDARRTVGIVLDGRHPPRHAILLALEIDQAQLLLVAAAMMADSQVARVAPPSGALADRQERLVRLRRRQVVVDQRGLEAQGRRYRSVCLDSHGRMSWKVSAPTQAPLSRFSGTSDFIPGSDISFFKPSSELRTVL